MFKFDKEKTKPLNFEFDLPRVNKEYEKQEKQRGINMFDKMTRGKDEK